jgi:EpsI family protein
VFLSFVTVLLLLAGLALRERTAPWPDDDRPTVRSRARPASSRALVAAVAGTILAIAVSPSARMWVQRDQALPAGIQLALPSPKDGSWRPAAAGSFGWKPHVVGADAETAQAFERNGRRVLIDVAYYTHDRPGAEAVGAGNTLAGQDWTQTNAGRVTVAVDSAELVVTETYLRSGARNLLVWQWYWVDGRFIGNAYLAKARQALAALLGRDRAAALVTVAVEYGVYDKPPATTLHDFVRDLGSLAPALQHAARSSS